MSKAMYRFLFTAQAVTVVALIDENCDDDDDEVKINRVWEKIKAWHLTFFQILNLHHVYFDISSVLHSIQQVGITINICDKACCDFLYSFNTTGAGGTIHPIFKTRSYVVLVTSYQSSVNYFNSSMKNWILLFSNVTQFKFGSWFQVINLFLYIQSSWLVQ